MTALTVAVLASHTRRTAHPGYEVTYRDHKSASVSFNFFRSLKEAARQALTRVEDLEPENSSLVIEVDIDHPGLANFTLVRPVDGRRIRVYGKCDVRRIRLHVDLHRDLRVSQLLSLSFLT